MIGMFVRAEIRFVFKSYDYFLVCLKDVIGLLVRVAFFVCV